MSFTIYLQSFKDEAMFQFPLSVLQQRFEKYIKQADGNVWCIGFDENFGQSEMYVGPGPLTDGFMIRKPPDNLEFWRVVAGLLKEFPSVLFWSGSGAVMGNLDLLRHLPKDFVETFGIPFVSTDPERIRQYVGENS